ncbi:Uracil phosphoribosyltransferase homolog [Strongyloides ratti]|uniref:Uracil phosphoribosyltransferase homolog n=1 Tax=Strongyloides ratti TaxID=34506 RepID=A0A090L547_STRRB|nr:Uracil phosphoribosyltransferase homolog [Strongyloides ratti]CEF64847.1 Uracil phosphoribosyltransferase homolog [Strongyloides ratti]
MTDFMVLENHEEENILLDSNKDYEYKRDELLSKIIELEKKDQVLELQTILRNRETNNSDFVFHADRLMRLVIEEGLNCLSYKEVVVKTPTGRYYKGLDFKKGNCAISLCRSGECMETAMRQCCRSMRIGKILISEKEQKVLYSKFPPDINRRQVLLCYPILGTGETVIKALRLLKEHNVKGKNIVLISIFSTTKALIEIGKEFSHVRIITSDVGNVPFNFTKKYFGTD